MTRRVEFEIEEVRDLDAAWPELEPLLLGIVEYHQPYDPRVLQLRPDWLPRWRSHLVSRTDASLLFARDQTGRAVGFLNGSLHRSNGIFAGTYAYIDDAFVVEEARGRGAGTALLERFETWSHADGAGEVRLDVVASNALGLEFWRNSGFEIDRYVMRKSLEASS